MALSEGVYVVLVALFFMTACQTQRTEEEQYEYEDEMIQLREAWIACEKAGLMVLEHSGRRDRKTDMPLTRAGLKQDLMRNCPRLALRIEP